MVALIASLVACGHATEPGEESRAREAYVRSLLEREGLLDLWQLSSRGDVIFDEGLSQLEVDEDSKDEHHAWYEVAPVEHRPHGVARRWMGQRVRILVHGDGTADMRLELRGRANLYRLFNRPRISVSFDGAELYSAAVEPDGRFTIQIDVARGALHGWSDVYVVLGSIHEPVRAPEVLQIAQLEAVSWEPRPGGRGR